jgi:ferric-dicitrate binding protein FerR (iron transport regulator)
LWAYSAVASIAILITFTLTYILFHNSSAVQESYIEAKTPYGVKSKIILPDNSVVYLNAGSVLKYPASFNKKHRNVILNGEAYFEVQKDSQRPFIVETGDVNIKVLGTHFNVKNYDVDNIIETSLLEGSVEVSENTDEASNKMILAQNQQALYNKSSHKITKNNVDAELTAIWKDGKYYFDHEKFSTITTKLERYFNYDIEIKSEKLNETMFSGLFDKNKTIFQILDIMKGYSNFNYKVHKDTITIEDIK